MNNLIGSAVCVCAVGIIVAGYIVHMWHVLRDIAKDEAREIADQLFDDYVRHVTYRVHTALRIVDERRHG